MHIIDFIIKQRDDVITWVTNNLQKRVPITRTINDKSLEMDIELSASDVGAMSSTDPTGTGSFSLNRKVDETVGDYSFAEGYNTIAAGIYSHTEGLSTTASEHASHAEGFQTVATGSQAHAEGSNTYASGLNSHAEGLFSWATGTNSHAEGLGTIASGNCQHVQGFYNIENTSYLHIVGNGEGEDSRSNAHTLDRDGNAWFAGDVTTAAGTSLNTHSHAWSSITDKPSTFTPSSHSHAWSEITGKPSTFAPSTHSHAISDVSGLQSALDGKAASGHTHSMAQVQSLVSTLNAKQATITKTEVTGKSKAAANTTVTAITSISLAAGTYLVLGHALIPSSTSTTGQARKICISTSTSFSNDYAAGCESSASFSTSLNCWATLTLSSTTTVYLLGYHQAGSSQTITNGRLTALKIA